MSEENFETVRQGFVRFEEAWKANDRTAYEAWLRETASPRFEYIPGADLPGIPTTCLGVEGFLEFLETFWAEFEGAVAEPQKVHAAGDTVVVRVHFRARGRRSGAEVELDQFQVWTFENGKTVRGEAFASPGAALEAAGLSE